MVIHLVKSQPPQPGSRPGGSSGSNNSNSADSSGRFNHPRYFGRVDGNTMFGSVVIPVIGETGMRVVKTMFTRYLTSMPNINSVFMFIYFHSSSL